MARRAGVDGARGAHPLPAAGATSDAAPGHRNRAATRGKPRNAHRNPTMGTAFVHTVLDDRSRVAYAEIHDDGGPAVTMLHRAAAWIHARGVTVERVPSDNGSAYQSRMWRQACAELGIKVKKTRPTGRRPTSPGATPRSAGSIHQPGSVEP